MGEDLFSLDDAGMLDGLQAIPFNYRLALIIFLVGSKYNDRRRPACVRNKHEFVSTTANFDSCISVNYRRRLSVSELKLSVAQSSSSL